MSLSRSPSPQRGGGWSSPGLTAPYNSSGHGGRGGSAAGSGRTSPVPAFANGANVTWATAQARSAEVLRGGGRGDGSRTRGGGFLGGHWRRISIGLPQWRSGGGGIGAQHFAEKEKLGRGRWNIGGGGVSGGGGARGKVMQILAFFGRAIWRMRLRLAIVLGILLLVLGFYVTPLHRLYRRSSYLGGGSKYVIILGANQGGGVMEWKGPREWAIERDSVKNKKKYARKWGYELEIVDMSTKKRYAHEWRESWEKVDTIRNTMRKYPNAEWFWWLDLNTFIMEPSYSLQAHIFNNLGENTYRDINVYNPLNISHPLTEEYLDPETRSTVGDGDPSSINLIVPQDCGGFNLGSFFVRRSAWTDRLFDIWWDPVGYEQKHMQWEHKEQDALESMYRNQPWVRPHVAFAPQRRINSFPIGACSDNGPDPNIHYQEQDRDFVVNMAGCEWGRDCWGEMYHFRQLSNRLNRNPWEKFKDWISDGIQAARNRGKEDKKS
ncbi:galactosyl transferase GMA12/MNN10 family-domain-containing protein [Lineolata rhizophorae]|uniref:Galactosyl transferase GMA12/MNN10 family-domain-containing protein n=1 Tax=Lineolata rhizophorae TaxID=578093 RepID=A0A6A6P889_9PEZI|nr:galactosyl transferase GMA12/MNN10 family-domain-containing protein [Lineolata rhizophorae]